MTILITGATGHVGRHLVTALLDRGETVRALSRTPENAGLPASVAVVEGSLATAPDTAFDGVNAVFIFPAEDGVDAFVEGAVAAGVTRFVVLSSLAVSEKHPRDRGSASQRHHRAVEDAVTNRTDRWTILRAGNFATNLLSWAYPIRVGFPVRVPYATSSQVLLHEADVAEAAAAALTGQGHDGRVFELTGPASRTKIEQLAAISAAIGREVPFVEVGPEEFRSDVAQYIPNELIDMLLAYWSDTVDSPEQPVPPPFDLAGRSLESWAVDHRADFVG